MAKRMYRSRVDSKIGGVCGGLAEYFDIDPTLLRVIAVLLVFLHGTGLIAYIVAWIIMPRRPLGEEPSVSNTAATGPNPSESQPPHTRGWGAAIAGMILILIGLLFLADNFWWWFSWHDIWPIALIAVGIFIITRGLMDRSHREIPAQPGGVSHDAQ